MNKIQNFLLNIIVSIVFITTYGFSVFQLIKRFVLACSVSVGVWTLVAISVERYYAICHPLRSLRWQTVKHAYKTICTIWSGSFICMCPIAILSQLQPTNQGEKSF